MTMTDLAMIKKGQQATWSSGDYGRIAWLTSPLGDALCEAAQLRQGARVLDVATGTGHVALSAARRLCTVSGIDYVPALIDTARARAAAEGLEVDLRVGDAEELPYADEEFDVVLSAIGVMFTADHGRAARELLRVTRPSGRIGLLNWAPEGQAARLFEVVARYAPPPPGAPSPLRWGTPDGIGDLFGDSVAGWEFVHGSLLERFASPEECADFFLAHFPPLVAAVAKLEDAQLPVLRADLVTFARGGEAFDYVIALGNRV